MNKVFSLALTLVALLLSLALLGQLGNIIVAVVGLFAPDSPMSLRAYSIGQLIFYVGLGVLIYYIFKWASGLWNSSNQPKEIELDLSKERSIFEGLILKVDWIKGIIKKRDWDLIQDLIVGPPATEKEIRRVENETGIKLPLDFRNLFKLSRRLQFAYQMNEQPPDEYDEIFSGKISWNLDRMWELNKYYKGWVEASLDPKYNDADAIAVLEKLHRSKIPLAEVANGDIIVVGNNPSEVVYLSHEGDEMHGKVLAKNLWDFLEFQSRVGFVGNEDWQFKPFYDFEKDVMVTEGEIVDRYLAWLNN